MLRTACGVRVAARGGLCASPSHRMQVGAGAVFASCRMVVTTGHLPTDPSSGWEMRRGHHLTSSVGQHSPFATACGRSFDPALYHEMLQACCDQQWMHAIQRNLRDDQEYISMLRQEGGVAKDLRMLTDQTQHDEEFMVKLKEMLKTDKRMSLTLCALQDSYRKIREKRDAHDTQSAADGIDPYASMKQQQQGSFGQRQPMM